MQAAQTVQPSPSTCTSWVGGARVPEGPQSTTQAPLTSRREW